jgi:hypothetical protein
MQVNIYKLNDCDWVAAESIEEARTFYKDLTGLSDDEAFEDEYQLDDEELDRLRFTETDDFDKPLGECSFREHLAHALANGEAAPFFFASTEQ